MLWMSEGKPDHYPTAIGSDEAKTSTYNHLHQSEVFKISEYDFDATFEAVWARAFRPKKWLGISHNET